MDDSQISILILEDNPTDAELIAATLAADGLRCRCDRVATRDQFVARLDGRYDLILSDYSLPAFDGIAAQQIASERRPDLPFVFVSGTMGEEVAIERMKAGATDFVLKQRLGRLGSAVRRALQEADARKERDRARDEVRRLNAELEGRVEERTRQLAAVNQELARRGVELQKATAFLDTIVENLPAVVFVKEARERRYLLFNRAGEELIGVSRRELLGHTDGDVFPAVDAEQISRRDAEVLREGLDGWADQIIQTREKGARILHVKKIPIANADGDPEYLLGIALDITERRQAEEAARLATLAAEQANRAKSEFLSRMSHDLRTPLNAILGFAQLLETEEALPDEHREHAMQIRKGGSHLLELINEILDIARIEAGHLSLSLEPLPVSGLLRDVIELMGPLAAARRITISLSLEAGRAWHVQADRQRLTQVLVNLVGNAIKYNHEGGQVAITGGRENGRVRLRVSDMGPGISPEKAALLFHPFERLGAEQSSVEGTGLGLAVAKRLVEAMNGAIGLEACSAGATFWIDLPEGEPAPESLSTGDPGAAGRNGSGTVLYIEDNRPNVRLVERLLSRRENIRLVTASEGREGIACAVRERPGLILLDLHLPGTSGEEVLQLLRRDDRTAGIPVAVLSADATPAQRERLLQSGAQAYLTKPLVLTALLGLLDEHLAGPDPGQPGPGGEDR